MRVPALLGVLGLLLGACAAPTQSRDGGTEASLSDIVNPVDIVLPDVPEEPAVVPPDAQEASVPRGPLRQLAPVSTTRLTGRRPTLRWLTPEGAATVHLELCAQRACATVQQSAEVSAGQWTPSEDLAPGVHFWRLRAGSATTPVWEFTTGHGAGRALATRGTLELNGDGLPELAVSSTHADNERGRVYLYAGAAGGPGEGTPQVLSLPDVPVGHFGASLTSAGDVDGDGFGELLIGAPDAMTGTGLAVLYRGGAAGIQGAGQRLPSPVAAGAFGASAAGVGDVNGDGYADVALSAPSGDGTRGVVYLYFGSAMGLPQRPSLTLGTTEDVGTAFGVAVAPAGDLNGDGFSDLVVGASGYHTSVGRAYVYLGATEFPTTPSVILDAPSGVVGAFGSSLAALGDVDGDGFGDLAVGAPSTQMANVYVFYGSAQGTSTRAALALDAPNGPEGAFGAVLAGADVDGDGFDDLLAGASCATFGHDPDGGYPTCGTGYVYVYRGGAQRLPSTPSAQLQGITGEPSFFGWGLLVPGDLTGDGIDDLAVSAVQLMTARGGVYLFAGGSRGLASTPLRTILGPDGANGAFGWALALRSVAPRPRS